MPSAIAIMPIFIIGAETLFLYSLELIKRLAKNNSKFNGLMFYNLIKSTFLLCVFAIGCNENTSSQGKYVTQKQHKLVATPIVGANQTEAYLPKLAGKRIGVVGNQTTVIFKKNGGTIHLVDSLLQLNVNVVKVFAPEHGFRGTADAGEAVKDGNDISTNLPIISLYGANKKPSPEQLEGIDLMIFDIQDIGVRFYTYISTLHYVMEACAENNIPLLILDRPNPNGHYIDGPVLQTEFKSFVGLHPVPVVHGMTIAEYAKMINGEAWLNKGVNCSLIIIPVLNYTHNTPYSLPIKPSPNLPNNTAINLYPSLCFFEGTNVSVGRGTDRQFQIFGSPFLDTIKYNFNYTFTPKPNAGAKHPKHEGKLCYGRDLTNTKPLNRIDLSYLIDSYRSTADTNAFFNSFFNKLAGNNILQQQIKSKHTAHEIRKTWVRDINAYKKMQKAYLLYK